MSLILAALLGALPLVARSYAPNVNYQLQCMGCHLGDGSGQIGRVPSFRRTFIPLSLTAEGRNFIIRVPGVAQSPLTDEETADLLNWIALSLCDDTLPAAYKSFTSLEVQRRRAEGPLSQVSSTRRYLMDLIRTKPAKCEAKWSRCRRTPTLNAPK
jgi:hypothetical protein